MAADFDNLSPDDLRSLAARLVALADTAEAAGTVAAHKARHIIRFKAPVDLVMVNGSIESIVVDIAGWSEQAEFMTDDLALLSGTDIGLDDDDAVGHYFADVDAMRWPDTVEWIAL